MDYLHYLTEMRSEMTKRLRQAEQRNDHLQVDHLRPRLDSLDAAVRAVRVVKGIGKLTQEMA